MVGSGNTKRCDEYDGMCSTDGSVTSRITSATGPSNSSEGGGSSGVARTVDSSEGSDSSDVIGAVDSSVGSGSTKRYDDYDCVCRPVDSIPVDSAPTASTVSATCDLHAAPSQPVYSALIGNAKTCHLKQPNA